MALIFFDGFRDAATLTKPEWGTATWQTRPGRDGASNTAGGNAAAATWTLALPSSANTIVAGFAFLGTVVGALGATASGGAFIQVASSGATVQLSLTFDPNGYIQLRRGTATGTILATATTKQFLPNIWYYVELKATLSTSSATVEVRVDETTVISFTGVTSTVTGPVTHLLVAPTNVINNGQWNYDDMYVLDTTDGTATQGRANSDYLGDVKVASLLPNAAGDKTQWTPTSGANYTTVNEATPNTTSYVSTSVIGNQDLYNLDDLPAAAVTIFGLRVAVYAQKSDAGTANVKTLVKEAVSGTISASAVQALSTSWTKVHGPMRWTKADGTTFSISDVNSLQAGIEAA